MGKVKLIDRLEEDYRSLVFRDSEDNPRLQMYECIKPMPHIKVKQVVYVTEMNGTYYIFDRDQFEPEYQIGSFTASLRELASFLKAYPGSIDSEGEILDMAMRARENIERDLEDVLREVVREKYLERARIMFEKDKDGDAKAKTMADNVMVELEIKLLPTAV